MPGMNLPDNMPLSRGRVGKRTGLGTIDPASATGVGLKQLGEEYLGLGLEQRLNRLNRPSSTISTPTAYGTREQYTPGVSFTSNDPLQGTIFEEGAFAGLDPLGIFDVPQIGVDIERIDPQYLSDAVAAQARRNAFASAALERELEPFTAQARQTAMQQLLGQVEGGMGLGTDVERMLMEAGAGIDMPELQQSELLNRAREEALRELELGYALPRDVQNLVMRTAAGRTSGAGTMGSLGRDVAARDLGLTSLDLFDRRMDRAAGLGYQQEQTNIGQQGLAANIAQQNRAMQMQAGGALGNLRQAQQGNLLAANQLLQGIEQPVAGLDPGDLASYMVGDVNLRNQLINQANVAQLNAATGAKSSQLGLMGDVFQGLSGLFGMCWIAQEVYQDDTWLDFQNWMFTRADNDLFNWYANHGWEFAQHLKENPVTKPLIKWWMDRKIAEVA